MPRSSSGGRRLGFAAAVPGVVLLILAAGCSQGVAQDLLDPMEQARSAVRSEQLAFDLLAQRRVTTRTAETVVKAMIDELISAEKSITSTPVPSEGEEPVRDEALAAARKATSASLAGRECLSQKRSCATATQELQSSADALQGVLDQLHSSR